MKLYIAHSSAFDYQNELYTPLKQAFGDIHELLLPHELNEQGIKSKDIIPHCDAILAEVSYPSTGQGIELGWADSNGVPIICFHHSDANVTSAIRFITDKHFSYDTTEQMVGSLAQLIEKLV